MAWAATITGQQPAQPPKAHRHQRRYPDGLIFGKFQFVMAQTGAGSAVGGAQAVMAAFSKANENVGAVDCEVHCAVGGASSQIMVGRDQVRRRSAPMSRFAGWPADPEAMLPARGRSIA
ncbi:hypothetical protein ET532_001275 [Verminephrobacter sp. Larva24]|nr:hypothetical protein ET532_001275 [Verminephrobacter sp. Larva24]MCW5294633.1 hypothetical protein [Verminephrobacter eiseniae]